MIASDVMTRNVISVPPDATVAQAVELMLERGIWACSSSMPPARWPGSSPRATFSAATNWGPSDGVRGGCA